MTTAIIVLQRELAYWREQFVREVEYWSGDENCDRAKEVIAECEANIRTIFDAINLLEVEAMKKSIG